MERSGRGGRRSQRKRLGTFTGIKDWRGERIGFLGGLRELLLAALVGVLPWWFGANDPPAIYLTAWIILGLSLLTLAESILVNRRHGLNWAATLTSLPALIFLLIAVYGLVQWVEVGPDLLAMLSRARHGQWKAWGGEEVLKLVDDPATYRQRASLAWLGDEVLESVLWLGVLWTLVINVMRLPGRWGPLKRHAAVLVVSGAAMGVQSMLQALTFNGKILWIRQAGIVISSAGPFFVHSHLAVYLNIALGFALAHILFMNWDSSELEAEEHMFADQRTGAGRGFLGIYATGLLIVAVLASRSRGGMLAMVLGGCLLGLVVLMAGKRARRFAAGPDGWLWVIGVVVVVSISMTMLTDVFSIFSQAKGIVGAAGSHAAGIRMQVWGLAWRTWRQSPLWGTGWGSFVWSSQTGYRQSVDHNTHAESDFVQVLPEGGLIGVMLVAAGLASLVWVCFRLVRRLEQPGHFALVGGALFGLMAAAWGSLTENNMRTAGVALPALVTAAHLVRLSSGWRWFETKLSADEAESTRIGLPEKGAGVLVGLVMVALGWLGVRQTGQVNEAWGILRPAGIHQAGTDLIGNIWLGATETALDEKAAALGRLESAMPGWGDYHIQRMLVEQVAYERRVKAALVAEGISEKEAESRSQVLQLAVFLKDLPETERIDVRRQLLADPVVSGHLSVAAASMAKAWRDQPSASLVHLESAILGWFLEQGPAPGASLRRAIDLCGNRIDVLLRTGQVAMSLGESALGVEAFAKCLDVPEYKPAQGVPEMVAWLNEGNTEKLAERSARVAVRVGESLVKPGDVQGRRKMGEMAIEKLREPGGVTESESAYLRSRATWLIGDRDEALGQMKLAMALNPKDLEPRSRNIHWLIEAGRLAEAVEQAQVCNYLWPNDPEVKKLLDMAVEAEAEGVLPARVEGTPKP